MNPQMERDESVLEDEQEDEQGQQVRGLQAAVGFLAEA